ncbi:DEAD/DEAH box helicase [Jatrophihabitans sp.]|uniref:DEAD/DEAH box helicase n=1 Tax=Jatrophihabitans sp. TaxID=1932789 RepID=UPI0038CD6F29
MAVDRPRSSVSPSPSTSSSPSRPGFAELGVPSALVAVLAANGVTTPFPIQQATLPDSLAGRDVLGRGRTGSGKTYAFALPVLTRLADSGKPRRPKRPRALILAPTRELASQIEASLAPLAQALSLRTLTVFGGVGASPQIAGLRAGVDVLVACPGRLEDLISSGHADLSDVQITVLDEADHMADLGFLPSVRRLLDRTPASGQRMLFSATLDAGVDVLVKRYLSNPVTHSVDPAQSPVSQMAHHVLHLAADDRLPVLVELTAAPGRTLVFTRTKHGAKKLTRQLIASGVPAVELHGNLSQNVRTRNLEAFSDGSTGTLVATDIAARGIHVDDINLVVHADPPVEHKAYLHRSGRTARAGAAGTVITLMTDDQVADVRDLTRRAAIRPTITRTRPGHPLLAELAPGERAFVTPPAGSSIAEPAGRGHSSGRGSTGRSAAGRGKPATGSASGGRGSGQGGTGRGSAGHPAAGRSAAGQGSSRQASSRRTSAGRGAASTPIHTSESRPAGSGPRVSGAAAFSAGARPRGRRTGA